ncbi:MAG: S41 family peptidase [Candidatus Tritonobacter lacicola]|nr:S41 family peptidase [Candidatus Tritonobacter lacicola]
MGFLQSAKSINARHGGRIHLHVSAFSIVATALLFAACYAHSQPTTTPTITPTPALTPLPVVPLVVMKNQTGDFNIYGYNLPADSDFTYWDASARNPSPAARDFWIIPSGNNDLAMAAVGPADLGPQNIAVLKLDRGVDQNLYLYNQITRGDWIYWDAASRNPSPPARDFWMIPAGNNTVSIAGGESYIVSMKNEGGDCNLYLYNLPVPGDWTYWDAFARNPSPAARDLWIIPQGDDVAAMCGLDTEGEGDSDSLVVVRNDDGNFPVSLWNLPEAGDWTYWDAMSRNPSAMAFDAWAIPKRNDLSLVTGIHRGMAPDDLGVMEDFGGDFNFYIWNAPVHGDVTQSQATARNPSPLARDFWCVPLGNDTVGMTAIDENNPLRNACDDYGRKGWTDAFSALHAKFSRNYAFTEWKDIDWESLYSTFHPLIEAAEAAGDAKAYYRALRGYTYSIPDGHVCTGGTTPEAISTYSETFTDEAGGSYGLALVGLADGRVVARLVTGGGPADQAGMEFGAEVIEWNGQAIGDALDSVSVLWGEASSATNDVRRLQQYRFIGRAPAPTPPAAQAVVTFKNPGAPASTTATLTVVNDDFETLKLTNFFATKEDMEIPVQYEILPSGYGYVKITVEPEEDDSEYPRDQFVTEYAEAIQAFVDQAVPGVILDLRRNGGGDDLLAAWVSGFFYTESSHYEYQAYLNVRTGKFEVDPRGAEHLVMIEPRSPYYGGRVVAMVGPGCISSGEGPAMAIQKLPQGRVISFYASNGSFGMSGAGIKMPIGFSVNYPFGQSLDENMIVQLDADENGNGGVIPDIRVPLDDDSVRETYLEGKDVELEFVIDYLNNNP